MRRASSGPDAGHLLQVLDTRLLKAAVASQRRHEGARLRLTEPSHATKSVLDRRAVGARHRPARALDRLDAAAEVGLDDRRVVADSSGVPAAMTSPSAMATMRSESPMISGMSCSMMSSVRSSSSLSSHEQRARAPRSRVWAMPDDGSSSSSSCGCERDEAGDLGDAPGAGRQLLDLLVAVARRGPSQRRARAACGSLRRSPPCRPSSDGEEAGSAATRSSASMHATRARSCVGNSAASWNERIRPSRPRASGPERVTSSPVEDDPAGVGLGEAAEQLERRRLAGAVGPDEPDDLAGAHVEARRRRRRARRRSACAGRRPRAARCRRGPQPLAGARGCAPAAPRRLPEPRRRPRSASSAARRVEVDAVRGGRRRRTQRGRAAARATWARPPGRYRMRSS